MDSYLPPNLEEVTDSYRTAREMFHKLDLTEYICPIIYDDLSYFQCWTLPTRLIYLDSNHHYLRVKQQIGLLTDRLITEGWLAFHDYVDKDFFGVIPTLNQFVDELTQYDLDIYDAGGTLVLVHKK